MRYLIVSSVLLLVACDSGKSTPAPLTPPAPAVVSAAPASIGTARMKDDGTIVMQLRAQTGGAVGDAQVTYAPTSPQYQDVLKHLGGLRPGEEKPVPPWPDDATRR
jgi:hypothetical protein